MKTRFEKDQAKIEEEIKFQSELVKEEEDKSEKSEKKLRDITFGLFRNLITDEEYLSVTAFLEDAYEDIVAPTDTYPDLLTMIKEIELKYESILLDLDKLPTDLVIKTKKRFYKEERRDIAEAKEAERKVSRPMNLFDLITHLTGSNIKKKKFRFIR